MQQTQTPKTELDLDIQCSIPIYEWIMSRPVNSSLYFDSGLIDSREDLGVNGDDANRVQYRKTATCSPLTTDGHILVTNSTFANNTVGLAAAFYGPNNELPATEAGAEDRLQNATYFTVDISEYKAVYDLIGSSAYSI